jgi:hypothetical protein
LNEAIMAHPAGESESDAPRLNFDRRLKLEFHGSSVTSDAGLLPFRELDDVLGLMVIAGQYLADGRTGRNARHDLIGMLRQSVFGRLAGYEDVNDADRLRRDPAMRWIVGGRTATKQAASTSQMGRFETEWLANDENLVALADLDGRWIDRVHSRRPLNDIVLDMDSSVSETYGDQEGIWLRLQGREGISERCSPCPRWRGRAETTRPRRRQSLGPVFLFSGQDD